MKVEVLVAAMHQEDPRLFRMMNLQSDAVIANQADGFAYAEQTIDDVHRVRLVTTPYRGSGRNRSTALLHAAGDICALSDEDVTWVDGYPEVIANAFHAVPAADILIFNLEYVGSGSRRGKPIDSSRRLRLWNALGYGAPRIAFRLDAVRRANVWFSPLFGAGARYSAGEESLFLAECLRKGLRIYTYPATLGRTSTESSTWFEGYTERYFRDKGAFFYSLSKLGAKLLCARDAVRHRRLYRSGVSSRQAYALMLQGIEDFRNAR